MRISALSSLHKYEKYALIAIIIAIALRFALVPIYAVSGDACWHFSASKYIAENHEIPLYESIGRDEPFWSPPLFHMIASFFYALLGNLGLKLVSPLFGSLSLIASYFILRHFLDEKGAFYGILFLSFIPLSIDYSILGYVESILLFFILLSLYFALKGRYALSGIAAGLAMLGKYNGAFIVPVILFIAYRNSKSRGIFIKRSSTILLLAFIISLPWLIRNWVLLGNPVWPFLNFMFNGYESLSYSAINPAALISIGTYAAAYLGFFGVPDGNLKALSSASIPYQEILFPGFLAVTLLFIFPLLFSFRKQKGWDVFCALLLSFLVLFLIYVLNVGPFVSRMLLPAIPALAFFYAIGAVNLEKKVKSGNIVMALLILASFGFAAAEAGKFAIAAKSWNSYEDDFEWAKSNTPTDAVFLAGGQCVQYRLERTSLFPSEVSSGKYDYAFVNQDFPLDRRLELDDGQLEALEAKSKLAYENRATGTKIYRITR